MARRWPASQLPRWRRTARAGRNRSGAPFDAEGVPRRGLTLVANGVVQDIAYCRQAALQAGAEPTGHGFPVPNETGEAPVNIVIAGGDRSVEEMIRSTERGILVTRF